MAEKTVTKADVLAYLRKAREEASREMASSCPFYWARQLHRLICELTPLIYGAGPDSVTVEVPDG